MTSQNYIFAIGIDNYSSEYWKNLNNAVLDAKKITELLIDKYNFEEFPGNLYNTQGNKSELFNRFTTLNNTITKNDNLVIFFAGHGNMDPITKKGFWIPSDATLDKSTWIENSSIKNFLSDCPAKHILLIIDSCFSGTFLTTTRSYNIEKSYLDLQSKKSRWVITSGNEEKVSDGVKNEHSPFMKIVIDFLNKNDNKFFSITELFNYIQVLINSSKIQNPQFNYIDKIGHEDGELVFTLSKNPKTEINKTIGIPNSQVLKEEYLGNISSDTSLSSGKEVLIVQSIVDDKELMIVENFRFDDNNQKKLRFKNNRAIIDEQRPELDWIVYRRFATVSGLMNYLEKNKNLINNKTVFLRAHEDIETIEETPYCKYYSQYLIQLYNNNSNKMNCLHCNEKITDNNSYLIEFDEIGYNISAGNVHEQCLRPIDRILGKSIYENVKEKNYLLNFDYEKWISMIQNGQGQLTGVFKNKTLNPINVLSWNPENNVNSGRFCIRINYNSGEPSFIMLGKQIQRFKEDEIEEWLNKFNESIPIDKPCKISETGINGYKEIIQKIIEPGQTITYVTSYENSMYSKQYEAYDSTLINDYTPLCYLTDEKDEIIKTGNLIPLISNPEIMENYIENWSESGCKINNLKIKIIESDLELGNLINIYYFKDLIFVINPFFDTHNQKLKAGLIIKTIDQIKQESFEKNKLRKGDKVNVIINPNAEKLPFGVLLEGEFIDEEGEAFVIFNPIEDGKILEMAYKMPTRIVKKI
ncbi:caspase family protein [Flavobacterium sp. Sr18]|uniref:caspase family protein n=1 Tax=Flavobacterium sp. Sr18 TaxID=935222 RepID=UPI0013E45BD1|nr:caspase family protein [Flavobacterium sp. Sr18]QIH38560.1 caspase family protein [Flavobacterium sp. Sr18]